MFFCNLPANVRLARGFFEKGEFWGHDPLTPVVCQRAGDSTHSELRGQGLRGAEEDLA
jgi:hypothetical protein